MPSVRSTLREFFESFYLPVVLERPQGRNLEGYRRALDLWERLTTNPALEEISATVLAQFKASLASHKWRGRGLHENTQRKHLCHVQWILDRAGPRSRNARDAAGLLTEVPWTRPPRPRRVPYRPHALPEQIAGVYRVADQARFPLVAGVESGDLWRALISTASCTALRIGQLVEAPMDSLLLDKSLLILPAGICRKSRTEEPHPLHPLAVRELLKVRGRRELLFPFYGEGTHSKTTIYNELHRLQELAGVERFGFHDIRRGTITALSAVSPAAAQLAAGHSSYKTTQIYQGIGLLSDAVATLPLMEQLESEASPVVQRRLPF